MNQRTVLPICCLLVAMGGSPALADLIPQLVVFGDSLTDSGNAFIASGGTMPPPQYYYEGRYSNGEVWVERLDHLGFAAPTPSLAPGGGTNFAFAGAETGQELVPPGMTTQVASYLSAHTPSATDWFSLFGGANNFFSGQTDPTVPAADVAALVQTLYDAGARKFLVLNLPPLGQTPGFRESPLEVPMDALSQGFNTALAAHLVGLRSNPEITIQELDVYGLLTTCIANPGDCGLTNVTEPAFDAGTGEVVGNPDEYLFWDNVHPTATGHQILADYVVVPEPDSVALLLAGGLILIATLRRRRQRLVASIPTRENHESDRQSLGASVE